MGTRGNSADPVLDLDGALIRLGGDKELFAEMVDYLLEDVPGLFRDLRSAVHANDPIAIRMQAHALKGLVAGCGGARAASAAQLLENVGDSSELSRADELIESLDDELNLLTEALTNHRR
ncbi:MAG: Hpt domain-containing protein [Planctomycetes bacterium]|nr:Hpt domain-containing protein [Planctomycetota bacterium]